MKFIGIGAFMAATFVFASSSPARAAAPQLSDLLDKVSAGAPIRLDASAAVKMPSAVPARAVPSSQSSRVGDAWAKLVAQAERKQGKKLTIEESRATGMTQATLEVRTDEAGVKTILLETSDLLMVGSAYIDTITDYTADEKGATLLNARAFILGDANGEAPHDPLTGSMDVASPDVLKMFAEEKVYWLKNARKAK